MKTTSKFSLSGSREGAVSEAIGFLLIFSLVMVGIGLVTLYGYPMLLETQSNANVRNMERDMIILQNDMKSLVYKNVPYKETSLQVSGGSLAVHNSAEMGLASFKIDVLNGDFDTEVTNNLSLLGLADVTCGQLRYESDAGESIIALENGAVLTRMEFQNGSAMLSEPRWFIDNNSDTNYNTLIITFIRISSDAPMSRNGIGTVKMKVINSEFYSSPLDEDGMTVKVTYNKNTNKAYDFSKACDNYFINSLDMALLAPLGNEYTRDDINNLVVKRFDIKIESI